MDQSKVCRDLGQRVIELRRGRKWTQQQLADRMQIDPRDLRRIEAGDNVTVHTLVRLAQALTVEIASLFDAPTNRHRRRAGRPKRS